METEEKDRRYASTLGKGLKVLRAFKPQDTAVGNREIARRTGLPSATVSRLTYTLAKHGFLVQIHPSEAFRLGPAAIALGYAARAGFMFLTLAEPLMQALADDVSTLVGFCIQDGNATLLARVWRPVNRPSIWLSEGHRFPMEGAASSRAIRAGFPPDETDSDETRQDRQMLQSRGFLLSLGDWHENINGCGVPFKPDPDSGPFAFICGAGADELGKKRLEEEVGPKLVEKVHALNQSLGLSA